MVFDIRGNVLVMRMRTLQCWIIRMRLRIVPVQFFLTLPNFIPIPVYHSRQTMIQHSLTNNRSYPLVKIQFASYSCQRCPQSNKRHCRATY